MLRKAPHYGTILIKTLVETSWLNHGFRFKELKKPPQLYPISLVLMLPQTLRDRTTTTWPKFMALFNDKQIFVLTLAEQFAEGQAYFTG